MTDPHEARAHAGGDRAPFLDEHVRIAPRRRHELADNLPPPRQIEPCQPRIVGVRDRIIAFLLSGGIPRPARRVASRPVAHHEAQSAGRRHPETVHRLAPEELPHGRSQYGASVGTAAERGLPRPLELQLVPSSPRWSRPPPPPPCALPPPVDRDQDLPDANRAPVAVTLPGPVRTIVRVPLSHDGQGVRRGPRLDVSGIHAAVVVCVEGAVHVPGEILDERIRSFLPPREASQFPHRLTRVYDQFGIFEGIGTHLDVMTVVDRSARMTPPRGGAGCAPLEVLRRLRRQIVDPRVGEGAVKAVHGRRRRRRRGG